MSFRMTARSQHEACQAVTISMGEIERGEKKSPKQNKTTKTKANLQLTAE